MGNSQTETEDDAHSFTPRRWLRGGHLQTLASFLIQRTFRLPPFESRLIEVETGVKVLCHCHWQPKRSDALTVIVVHGLEGSSESQYMLGVAEKAFALGMNVIRYNQRNCGGTDALAPVLYHSGLSNDVAVVARELFARDGVANLALVGFSMGGNIVLKLAGEWPSFDRGASDRGASSASSLPSIPSMPRLRAVAACCPAIDLSASADALHEPSNRIYELYFLWALRRRLRQKARFFPGRFDVGRLRGIRSLREFDDKITAYYCGFADVDDYYDRASAAHVVDRIAVSTMLLYAKNDPFIRITDATRRKILANSNVDFVETGDGGHCAFIGTSGIDGRVSSNNSDNAPGNGHYRDGYWAENEIVTFLRRFQ